jgi:hypothetical protein
VTFCDAVMRRNDIVWMAGTTGYCQREVEPMGKECEQVHVIALTEYLGVGVCIEYMDGRCVFRRAKHSCLFIRVDYY